MEADLDVINSPEVIDQILCSEIENFSEQENDFWSSIKRDPREYAHSLFQYPAMMVPLVQKKVIELIVKVKPETSKMLDPYVGAGTTFTAAMSCGLDCYGQDINPLAILVSKAKTELGWEDQNLIDAYTQVVAEARTDPSTNIAVSFPNMEKWFQSDVSIELSKIRRAIIRQADLRIRRILWVILAETIRQTSNDRTSTYKLHVRPIEQIQTRLLSPIQIFESLAQQSAKDVIKFKHLLVQDGLILNNRYKGHTELRIGNTTQIMLSPRNTDTDKFEFLVTSPPYGDNTSTITYGQNAYLPLQWINLADIDPQADISFLRTTQEIDRRSLGGNTPKELENLILKLAPESESLAAIFIGFRKSVQPKDRAARVASFYQDFIVALDRILSSLAGNSYMVWTVGNRSVGGMEIPNDQILTELLANRHTILVADINRSIHFKRMPHKNKIAQLMGSEKIMIFRKQPNGGVNNE
jgi:hypothetical protein